MVKYWMLFPWSHEQDKDVYTHQSYSTLCTDEMIVYIENPKESTKVE